MKNMSISKQIIISSTLVALLALFAGYLGYRNMSNMGFEIEDCVNGNLIVTNHLDQIQDDLIFLDKTIRAGSFSNEYSTHINQLELSTKELMTLNVEGISAMMQIKSEYDSYAVFAKNGKILDPTKIDQTASRARLVLQRAQQKNAVEMKGKSAVLHSSVKSTAFWISLVCVIIFAMAIVFGQLIARALNKSLLSLEHSAAEILKGNFSAKVDIKSKDEFGYLAQSFNHLAENVRQTQVIEDQKNEMVRLNDELRLKNESLDSFVYRVSHDLKAPLLNLASLQKVVMSKMTDQVGSDVKMSLKFMEQNTIKLQQTIYDLLDVSRIQNSANKEAEDVNLLEVINEVILENKESIENSKTKIRFDLEVEHLFFSRTNLKSIFSNLITNSLKYKAENRENLISISTTSEGINQILSVRDNGIGIDLEKHGDKVFGFFSRFHNHVEGSGVGLYIVKTVIEKAGGKIELKSKVGVGTEIVMTIPKKEYSLQQAKMVESKA